MPWHKTSTWGQMVRVAATSAGIAAGAGSSSLSSSHSSKKPAVGKRKQISGEGGGMVQKGGQLQTASFAGLTGGFGGNSGTFGWGRSFPILSPLDPGAAALQQNILSSLGAFGLGRFFSFLISYFWVFILTSSSRSDFSSRRLSRPLRLLYGQWGWSLFRNVRTRYHTGHHGHSTRRSQAAVGIHTTVTDTAANAGKAEPTAAADAA